MPIEIPICDEFMDKDCRGSYEIPFNRSFYWKEAEDKPREQVNFISAWLDGSQVYGSDEETLKRLRKFEKGEMITDNLNFLPRVRNNRFNLAGGRAPSAIPSPSLGYGPYRTIERGLYQN